MGNTKNDAQKRGEQYGTRKDISGIIWINGVKGDFFMGGGSGRA